MRFHHPLPLRVTIALTVASAAMPAYRVASGADPLEGASVGLLADPRLLGILLPFAVMLALVVLALLHGHSRDHRP